MALTGYDSEADVKRDASKFLMNYYNWERPHQFNKGISPAKVEELAKKVFGYA